MFKTSKVSNVGVSIGFGLFSCVLVALVDALLIDLDLFPLRS